MNGARDLQRCLETVGLLDYQNVETLVVDNGSSDGSPSMVRQRFPGVRVLEMKRNLGYGGGNNAGARASRGDLLFFLNNDVMLERDSLRTLVESARMHPTAGVFGCKVFYCDEAHTLQHAGGVLHRSGSGIMLGNLEKDNGQYDKERTVDWVIGAAWLVRRNVFALVGGFDMLFHPIYHDEIDVSVSASELGYETVYCPRSIVYHCDDLAGKAATLARVYLRYRNRTVFMMKHYGFRGLLSSFLYEYEYLQLRKRLAPALQDSSLSRRLVLLSFMKAMVWILRNHDGIYKRHIQISRRL